MSKRKSTTVSTHGMVGQPRLNLCDETKEHQEMEKLAAKALNGQEEIESKEKAFSTKMKKPREAVQELITLLGDFVEKLGKKEVLLSGVRIKNKGSRKTILERVGPQAGELKAKPGDKTTVQRVAGKAVEVKPQKPAKDKATK